MKSINGQNKIFFGTKKQTNENIYMDKPTFDCNRYWSFGYLGNTQCHYHLESYQKNDIVLYTKNKALKSVTENRNISMRDALLEDYDLSANIKSNLLVFCELSLSIYTLKKAADLFHTGGANMTTNPSHDLLKDSDMYTKLVNVLIPEQCQKLWDLIS